MLAVNHVVHGQEDELYYLVRRKVSLFDECTGDGFIDEWHPAGYTLRAKRLHEGFIWMAGERDQ